MWPPWTLCCVLLLGALAIGQRCDVRDSNASIAVNSFGLTLFQHIKKTTNNQNTVLSPLSVSTAASFIALFSNGTTKHQVDEVFNFDSEGIIPQILIRQQQGGSYDTDVLALANCLFLQQDIDVEEAFERTAGDSLKKVNFRRPKRTVKNINAWVEDRTNGLINGLLSKGSLNAQTRLVLVNAVLFQSNWDEAFEPASTRTRPFYGEYGSEEGSFMHQFDRILHWKEDPLIGQVLELPYEGSLFSMYIVLPVVGSNVVAIAEAMSRGDAGKWLTEGNRPLEFSTIAIPKFEIELSLGLNEALGDLGVVAAFDPVKADFTPITQEVPLHIDKGLHKAKIIVNETGTRAAGVTAFNVLALSARIGPEQHFIADRPFMYFIVDKQECIVLFMGSVETLRQ